MATPVGGGERLKHVPSSWELKIIQKKYMHVRAEHSAWQHIRAQEIFAK